ncbi:MAG TPA: hypothetical protein VF583_09685 [Bradyrhizobium sp.]
MLTIAKCFKLMLGAFACGALTQLRAATFMSHSARNIMVDDIGHGFCNDPAGRIGNLKFVAVPQRGRIKRRRHEVSFCSSSFGDDRFRRHQRG